MNFFWTKNEFDNWTIENSINNDENIYCLDIDEAMKAAEEVFSVY